jgi:hypothetical protein
MLSKFMARMRLQIMIDELSKRADESDMIALLASSRRARLYNADLARELSDVVGALKEELARASGLGLLPLS